MKSRCGLKHFAQEFGGMGGEFSDLWYPMIYLSRDNEEILWTVFVKRLFLQVVC